MTPMQMLKNSFDNFKSFVPNFKEVTLNKSEPKMFINYFGGDEPEVHENRGVKSDFIKIFKLKYSKENQHSVGFEFKYLNLNKEDFRVRVSVKEGEDNLFLGDFINVENFRESFNKVIAEMKSDEGLNGKEVFTKFKNEFNLHAPVLTKQQTLESFKRKNKF